jgi:hypothetical protein
MFSAIQFFDPIADARTNPPTPIWPLTESEAKSLGKATNDYLKSIPPGQRSAARDFLQKNLPLVMLTVSIGMAAQPRLQASIEHKKVVRDQRSMAAQGQVPGRPYPRSGNGRAASPSPDVSAEYSENGSPGGNAYQNPLADAFSN